MLEREARSRYPCSDAEALGTGELPVRLLFDLLYTVVCGSVRIGMDPDA
jgi:hypothetical protein